MFCKSISVKTRYLRAGREAFLFRESKICMEIIIKSVKEIQQLKIESENDVIRFDELKKKRKKSE